MTPSPAPPRRRLPEGFWPALSVLALGLGVLCLRPALPIDETRYLEVFHESLRGSPLLLRLGGEPYAEKPPLLFWLARALTWLALPPHVALRLVPLLASALTVLLSARLGARVGLGLVGWLQAALWIPALGGQFLIFDPLLSVAVWGALDAWVRGRDGQVSLWSAAALLAKGPVALLFLVTFLWALAPLRAARAGAARRAGLALGLALLPLAAWALSAAALGGPEFADALLWERWAGRVVRSADHARSRFFYVPVVLLGALPATLLLFLRAKGAGYRPTPGWVGRLGRGLLFLLVVFTLISGKQAHYLVPMAPALALCLAWRLEGGGRETPWLRRGVRVQLGLLLCVALVGLVALPRLVDALGPHGRERIQSGLAYWPLLLVALSALAGLLATRRVRESARGLLLVAVASSAASLLPLHWLAGQLLYPHDLARTLAERDGEVAFLGSSQHGLYQLLAGERHLEKLLAVEELGPWSQRHPDGLLIVESKRLTAGTPEGLSCLTTDVVHRSPVQVLAARRAPEAARERP